MVSVAHGAASFRGGDVALQPGDHEPEIHRRGALPGCPMPNSAKRNGVAPGELRLAVQEAARRKRESVIASLIDISEKGLVFINVQMLLGPILSLIERQRDDPGAARPPAIPDDAGVL